MKVLIAPDKFKSSISAFDASKAIDKGLKSKNPGIETIIHPMADGGDGSIEVIAQHLDLEEKAITTQDPLGRELLSSYFFNTTTAFIELAKSSGLHLLKKEEQNPIKTSTYGTGILVADAIRQNFKEIVLFLGGSATNDAGMGILSAMGFKFMDQHGNQLDPVGENLIKVASIKPSGIVDFHEIKISLLCDVQNPLFGMNGAAHCYAEQKGAKQQEIELLDQGLRQFSNLIHERFGMDISGIKGAGAAGGIFAGMAAIGACVKNGFEEIASITGLEEKLRNCDLVISGEGKVDRQSMKAKVVGGMASLCKKYGKALSLFVGKNELSIDDQSFLGIESIVSIMDFTTDTENAMKNAASYLEIMANNYQIQ